MNKHLKKAIDTIRSGVWKKNDGNFGNDGSGEYCILGALTQSYKEQTGDISVYDDEGCYTADEVSLLEKVQKFFGFKEACPKVLYNDEYLDLYDVNDDTNMTLPQMADLIASQADELTVKPKKTKKKATLPKGAVPVPVEFMLPSQRVEMAIAGRKKIGDE